MLTKQARTGVWVHEAGILIIKAGRQEKQNNLLTTHDDQQSQNQDEPCDTPLGRERRALAQKNHTQSRKIREGTNYNLGLRCQEGFNQYS